MGLSTIVGLDLGKVKSVGFVADVATWTYAFVLMPGVAFACRAGYLRGPHARREFASRPGGHPALD